MAVAIRTILHCDNCGKKLYGPIHARFNPYRTRMTARSRGWTHFRWKGKDIDLCRRCTRLHPAAADRRPIHA